MATKGARAPAKAGPIANGATSLEDTLKVAQNIKDAITSFASEGGYQALSELVDSITELKANIRQRDEQLNELSLQLKESNEKANRDAQTQLQTFGAEYKEWAEEKDTLLTKIENLHKGVHEKNGEVAKLQGELKGLQGKHKKLENGFNEKAKMVEKRGQEISSLQKELQAANAEVDRSAKALKQSQSQVAKTKESLLKKSNEFDKLKDDSTELKLKFEEVLKFAAPLKDVAEDVITNQMEDLWDSASALVTKFVGVDLPDVILQNDWTKLRESPSFKHKIPLPQSNSPIAKVMRRAIVLGALATLVDKYIFEPTYLVEEESGLRELLRLESLANERRERFVRAIFLSMYPDRQAESAKDRRALLIADLLDQVFDVKCLLIPETARTFAIELSAFLEKAQGVWRSIQTSEQKFEPDFHYSPASELPWKNFSPEVEEHNTNGQPMSPIIADGLVDDVVLCPRVYRMEGEEPKPITSGIILQKSQLRVAAEEVRRSVSHAPFAQPHPSRHRSSRSRTLSFTATSTYI